MQKFNYKILVAVFIAMLLGINISAQVPDFSGIKICIDPGHIGHEADDRGMPNGFWESEGNLTKGLWLRDILEARNCGVVMTREDNIDTDPDSETPSLSTRRQIAYENDVDFFISIHSNAGNQVSNYPMPIFNGHTNEPRNVQSKEFAITLWEHLITNKATFWTNDDPHYIGDLTLNTSWSYGYGVLYGSVTDAGGNVLAGDVYPTEIPGIISEGSFHDYQPEVDRLLNIEYRKQESWNIYYAFIDYFNISGQDNFGLITGLVRDSLLVKDNYNILNSPDLYEVVDGTIVKIEETGEIYNVDSLNTGFYYFDSIPSGTYHLIFSAKDYLSDTVEVVVNNAKITYYNEWIKADKTMPPNLISSNPSDGETIRCFDPIQFTFNMNMDSASFSEAFSISPSIKGSFEWDDKYLNVWFQPELPYETNTKYDILVNTTAKHQWGVSLVVPIELSFTTDGRNRFLVESNFPANNQLDISPFLQFRIIFDAPLKNSSLIGAVSIIDAEGVVIGTKGANISTVDNKGHYYFVSDKELEYNKNYILQLLGSIQDATSIPLVDTVKIEFSTHKNIGEPTIIDEFENIDDWSIDLTQSSEIDGNTFLYRWSKEKRSGDASMLLRYNFLDANGECFIQPESSIELNSSQQELGMWVWGEMSNNEINFTFDNDIEQLLTIIDFAGWKYCSIIIPENATKLTGVKLAQAEKGATGGDVFFDALGQTEVVGADYNEEVLSIKVFPNPITGNSVNISGLINGKADYTFYNLNGQFLQKGTINSKNIETKIVLNESSKSHNIVYLQIISNRLSNTFLLINKK